MRNRNQNVNLRGRYIAVGSLFFLLGLSFSTWTSRIADMQQQLNLTDGQLGTVLFAMPVGLWISLAFSGWLVKKYTSKRVAIWALLLYHLMLLLVGSSVSSTQLMISLFFSGLCYSAVNVSMNTQGTFIERDAHRTLLPLFHGIWSVAGFIGAAAGTLFIKNAIPVFSHFVIVASLGVLAILVTGRQLIHKPELEKIGKAFAIPKKSLFILGVIAFFAMICEATMYDWSVVYFQKEVPQAKDNIGLGYAVFMGMMAMGRFANNFLLNRYAVRNLIFSNACLIFLGTWAAVSYPSLLGSSIGFGLIGWGISSMVPLVAGVAGKTKNMAPASGIASVLTIGFIGFLIGPPLIGYLADYYSLKLAFGVLAVSAICIGALSRCLS